MKKFYKLVSSAKISGGFAIHLDGKPIRTPAREILTAPTRALADDVAKEWAAQRETILPDTMPLTQILTTAQDHVTTGRAGMTEKILAYLDTDLLCYRTASPPILAQRQAEGWDQWLIWFQDKYGQTLATTTDLKALKQPEEAHNHVAAAIEAMTDFEFTILQMVTVLTGSLVLGLVFVAGDATAAQLYEAAHIDEIYKAEIYNEAEHGAAPLQEKKQAAMKRDLEAARVFLDLVAE